MCSRLTCGGNPSNCQPGSRVHQTGCIATALQLHIELGQAVWWLGGHRDPKTAPPRDGVSASRSRDGCRPSATMEGCVGRASLRPPA
eukprot:COSAG01_NODE_8043_length_2944_cov_2.438664_1_plen_87_part_00